MTNEKLIYASAARSAVLKVDPSLAYVIDQVKPVDAVEVVRCKDCKLRYTEDCSMQYTDYSEDTDANPEGISMEWTEDNDFCSCGERKEE